MVMLVIVLFMRMLKSLKSKKLKPNEQYQSPPPIPGILAEVNA